MTRCEPVDPRVGPCRRHRRRWLAAAWAATAGLVWSACPGAWAQAVISRPFPADALRGELVVLQPPEISLNRQAARLSPGARIHGPDNLLVMSGALVGQTLLVHYQLEPTTGLVQRVWILNETEAAKRPWPTTAEQAARWLFDPAAQTWTRR